MSTHFNGLKKKKKSQSGTSKNDQVSEQEILKAVKRYGILESSYQIESSYMAASMTSHTSVGDGKKTEFVGGESAAKETEARAPMTIFYKGNITYTDVTPQQGEKILKLAKRECSENPVKPEPAPTKHNNKTKSEPKGEEISTAGENVVQPFLERGKGKKRELESSSP